MKTRCCFMMAIVPVLAGPALAQPLGAERVTAQASRIAAPSEDARQAIADALAMLDEEFGATAQPEGIEPEHGRLTEARALLLYAKTTDDYETSCEARLALLTVHDAIRLATGLRSTDGLDEALEAYEWSRRAYGQLEDPKERRRKIPPAHFLGRAIFQAQLIGRDDLGAAYARQLIDAYRAETYTGPGAWFVRDAVEAAEHALRTVPPEIRPVEIPMERINARLEAPDVPRSEHLRLLLTKLENTVGSWQSCHPVVLTEIVAILEETDLATETKWLVLNGHFGMCLDKLGHADKAEAALESTAAIALGLYEQALHDAGLPDGAVPEYAIGDIRDPNGYIGAVQSIRLELGRVLRKNGKQAAFDALVARIPDYPLTFQQTIELETLLSP